MKRLLLILVIYWTPLSFALAQDMIVIPKMVYRTTECKIISADKQNVIYITPESDLQKSLSTEVIARINFGKISDQIVRSFLIYDTIPCEILAVNSKNIEYFSESDYVNQSIPKPDVLVCFFNSECTTPEYKEYLGRFQQLQDYAKVKRKNIIVKQDGNEIETSGVEIDEKSLYFELYQSDTKIQTFIDRSKVRSFVYSEYYEAPEYSKIKVPKILASDYLLSRSGRMLECNITSIDTAKLYLETVINDKIVNSELDKDKVCAVFFGPLDIDFKKSIPVNYQSGGLTGKYGTGTKVEFNLSGMWSYRWASVSESIPYALEDYAKQLRSGFGFGANMNVFVDQSSAIGITYKLMNSHNSIDNINISGITSTSDKINVNFFGLNYQYSTVGNSHFIYDFGLAVGYVMYKDNSTLNQIAVTLEGNSYGINFTNRFNIMADNNFGLFFDFSIFLSFIKEYKFEDQTIELEEPDNLSRIELGTGIKFSGE